MRTGESYYFICWPQTQIAFQEYFRYFYQKKFVAFSCWIFFQISVKQVNPRRRDPKGEEYGAVRRVSFVDHDCSRGRPNPAAPGV
jgi:hypothetical protein